MLLIAAPAVRRHTTRSSASPLFDDARLEIGEQSPSAAARRQNRPFSSRFAQTHSPLPSPTRTFSRLQARLGNRNRCPSVAHQSVPGSVQNFRRQHPGEQVKPA
jgi:hypothetical protein